MRSVGSADAALDWAVGVLPDLWQGLDTTLEGRPLCIVLQGRKGGDCTIGGGEGREGPGLEVLVGEGRGGLGERWA